MTENEYLQKLKQRFADMEDKWNQLSETELNLHKKNFIESLFKTIHLKKLDIDKLTPLLSMSGKLLGKYLNDKEQKVFLNNIVDCAPQYFRIIVGELNGYGKILNSFKPMVQKIFPKNFIQKISKNGFDISLVDLKTLDFRNGYLKYYPDESTKLSWFSACKCGNIRSVKEFLALGINPGMHDNHRSTALHIFAEHHPEKLDEMLSMLLSRYYININTATCWSNTLLNTLAKYHPEKLKKLLPEFIEKYDMNPVKSEIDGKTVLHVIAGYHPDKLRDLLPWLSSEYHLDVNWKDEYNRTIIHYIAKKCPEKLNDLLPWLVDNYGVDIDVQDKDDNMIVHYIARFHWNPYNHFQNLPELLSYIIKNSRKDLLKSITNEKYFRNTNLMLKEHAKKVCLVHIEKSIEDIKTLLGKSLVSEVSLNISAFDEINAYIKQLEITGVAPFIKNTIDKWNALKKKRGEYDKATERI